jgi:hypothetical protein
MVAVSPVVNSSATCVAMRTATKSFRTLMYRNLATGLAAHQLVRRLLRNTPPSVTASTASFPNVPPDALAVRPFCSSGCARHADCTGCPGRPLGLAVFRSAGAVQVPDSQSVPWAALPFRNSPSSPALPSGRRLDGSARRPARAEVLPIHQSRLAQLDCSSGHRLRAASCMTASTVCQITPPRFFSRMGGVAGAALA